MRDSLRPEILQSRVRSIIGILFIGSFAAGASLMIWHAASGDNPIEDAFAAQMVQAQGEGY